MALSDSAGVGSGLPSQVGQSGNYLTTDGTIATWAAVAGGSGVTTMAAVGASPSANAASISGVTLTMQPADATHPGVVTTASQTFGGTKTFSGTGSVGIGGSTLLGTPDADTAGHLAMIIDTPALTNADVLSIRTAAFELCKILRTGATQFYASGNFSCGPFFSNGTVSSGASPAASCAFNGVTSGNGASIKLKSPDGTTYTITVANGGTLLIT